MYRSSSNIDSLVKKNYEDILYVREKVPRCKEIGVDDALIVHSKS